MGEKRVACAVQGPLGAGKTAWLVGRAAELLRGGAAPEELLVLCATPNAAADFERRLRAACGDAADGVRVATPLACALGVLGVRPLAPYEVAVVLGDLQPLGIRPERLEQILRFFERSWADLAHRNDGWLVTYEERLIVETLDAALGCMEAVLPAQVVPFAADRLLADPTRAMACGVAAAHVLVDDYLLLDRASQELARLLATESLTVAFDPDGCAAVAAAYPYEGGFQDLADAFGDVAVEGLPDRCGVPALVQPYGSAAEEFLAVAGAVAETVARGVAPERVVVAAQHPTWRANLAIALGARGVPVDAMPNTLPFAADIRSRAAGAPLFGLTLLRLAADGGDGVAWRVWCGLGDHFVQAAACAAVRAYGTERGLDFAEALEALAEAGSSEGDLRAAEPVVAAYRAGRALVGELEGLTGRELLERAAVLAAGWALEGEDAAAVDVAATRAVAAIEGLGVVPRDGEGTASLVERAGEALTMPRAVGTGVLLGDAAFAWGVAPAFAAVAGCMDGFLPSATVFRTEAVAQSVRDRVLKAETYAARGLLSRADEVVATMTTALPEADAARLGLEVERIRLKDGVRTATLRTSSCLEA